METPQERAALVTKELLSAAEEANREGLPGVASSARRGAELIAELAPPRPGEDRETRERD